VITRTLQTVFTQDFSQTEYEMIVVIDGASEDAAEMLQTLSPSCGFCFHQKPNQGWDAVLIQSLHKSSFDWGG
jgi:cellulose synthase/poly-beta-1,6-N-acetylglucosamine synthase-like glycosyltransferase